MNPRTLVFAMLLGCMPAVAQFDYKLDIIGARSFYAGSDAYLSVTPVFTSGTPTHLFIADVQFNRQSQRAQDYCLQPCFSDGAGRPWFWDGRGTFELRVQIPAGTPAGNYTIAITIESSLGLKTFTWPTGVIASPAPLPPVASLPSIAIPNLQLWETTRTNLGYKWCPTAGTVFAFGDESQAWYYDGARTYFQMADATGDARWNTCALDIARQYRDFVIANQGGLPGWRIFTSGLRMAYERTGDRTYRDAVVLLSKNAAFANIGGGVDDALIRETAYVARAYMDAEKLGEPRNPMLARSIDRLLGHYERIFVSRAYTIHQTFFDGLAAEALIAWYEMSGDPRVPAMIRIMLDWMWDYGWNKNTHQLVYDPDSPWYMTELVNMVAPAFAWYWSVTGDATYQIRGDEMFEHSLDTDISYNGKIFNQNFGWGHNYVQWRSKSVAAPPTCTVTASPASATIPAGGGSTAIAITASASTCAWTGVSDAAWLVLTPSSGMGSATAIVSATPNPNTQVRTGTLTIAGQSVTITQAAAAPCSWAITPASISLPASGGSAAIAVSASSASCAWTSANSAAWLTLSPASGTGSGSVTVSASANTLSQSRTATFTIAGQVASITQAAAPAPCTFTVAPGTANVASGASTFSVQVTASSSSCTWSANSNAAWLTVSPATGTGSAAVTVSVAANSLTGTRTATLTIAGQTVTVVQAAPSSPCTFSVTPAVQNIGAAGGAVNFGVQASATHCGWEVTRATAAWTTIVTGPSRGSGTATINVAPNTSRRSRVARVSIAGISVYISQSK